MKIKFKGRIVFPPSYKTEKVIWAEREIPNYANGKIDINRIDSPLELLQRHLQRMS